MLQQKRLLLFSQFLAAVFAHILSFEFRHFLELPQKTQLGSYLRSTMEVPSM